jgi:hypothetical protein
MPQRPRSHAKFLQEYIRQVKCHSGRTVTRNSFRRRQATKMPQRPRSHTKVLQVYFEGVPRRPRSHTKPISRGSGQKWYNKLRGREKPTVVVQCHREADAEWQISRKRLIKENPRSLKLYRSIYMWHGFMAIGCDWNEALPQLRHNIGLWEVENCRFFRYGMPK